MDDARQIAARDKRLAEAVFKPATSPADEPVRAQRKCGLPVAKELVSIKLGSDLLAHFQEDGPGWRERINNAPRRTAGPQQHRRLPRTTVSSTSRETQGPSISGRNNARLSTTSPETTNTPSPV
ncbi:hypothetical protein CCR94_07170 [Rhodoblastus sphagnicola]|uniref:Uncharacterized protein n=1 Tax=Rhodoblastus sphagnicola TaxID=333368 RepID=A0A2S6NBS6_9HYPH|nr:hypothetical protein CCR94_07170 [Rhodoblastus sphagnicola]